MKRANSRTLSMTLESLAEGLYGLEETKIIIIHHKKKS